MGAVDLNLVMSPEEFFYDRVSSVLENQSVTLNKHVEFYVVNLLCEYIDPSKISTPHGDVDVMDTPLALLLKAAVEAPRAERIKIFKVLGDTSLYFTGFFQEFFNGKTFDISYYIDLGATAYDNVSDLLKQQNSEDQFAKTYSTLSEKFVSIVDVVAEVSEGFRPARDTDLLAVYDRWISSSSDRLRKVLEENGIFPIPVNMNKAQ